MTVMVYNTSSLIFLSTLSLRRATTVMENPLMSSLYFYPRSPCGERLFSFVLASLFCVISIHALLAESDPMCFLAKIKTLRFLSTLSLRRATFVQSISPRYLTISIHALLAESDGSMQTSIPVSFYDFYPRSPCGERLSCRAKVNFTIFISIHALLAESDSYLCVRA